MSHIFISYSHHDTEFVERLKAELRRANFMVWVDDERLRAGEDWRQSIDDAIRTAMALIIVITPEADQSKYVTYEWACAWGASIPVIPLILKPARPHPRLEVLQHLDFTDLRTLPWQRLIIELRKIEAENPQRVLIPAGTPANIRGALEALNDWDPERRTKAARVLAEKRHDSVVPALITILRDEDVMVRETAVIALGNIGNPMAVPALRDVLQSPNGDMRLFAIGALGKIHDASVVPTLVDSLFDEDRTVREVASEALDSLIEIADQPPIVEALSNSIFTLIEALFDEDFEIRDTAALTIGKMGRMATNGNLLRLSEVLYSTDRHAQYAAESALVKIGTNEAKTIVEKWRRDHRLQERAG